MSKEGSIKTPKMRLVKAERSEPKEFFPCSMCVTKTKVYRRYRFVLQDEKGQQKAYCLPCASYILQIPQGQLRKQADSNTKTQAT
ncbi:MAG: hypothetical protein GX799_02720 [Crenarchaeota archaeon]|jgi:hypothetical protein|nr:hypothetical protein [Thermoproteota archaeon]